MPIRRFFFGDLNAAVIAASSPALGTTRGLIESDSLKMKSLSVERCRDYLLQSAWRPPLQLKLHILYQCGSNLMGCQLTADMLTLGLLSSLRAGQLVGTLVSPKVFYWDETRSSMLSHVFALDCNTCAFLLHQAETAALWKR